MNQRVASSNPTGCLVGLSNLIIWRGAFIFEDFDFNFFNFLKGCTQNYVVELVIQKAHSNSHRSFI